MTIGDLLKEYRIEQGKYQRDFTNNGMIVSQSFYSKVEKNLNKITAESLLELLNYNNIPLWDFFGRLTPSDDLRHRQIKYFNNVLVEAYYENNKKKIEKLKPVVKESILSDRDKEEELLIIEAWLELMKNTSDKPNNELRKKIKERIFNIPNFTETKVVLFCNFMHFYDFESNKIISKKIIDQYLSTSNIKLQVAVIAIITNIAAFSLEDGKENEALDFIAKAKKIKIRPELVFYKLALLFFENIINYRLKKNKKNYQQSKGIVDTLFLLGMTQYGTILKELLLKYK